MAGSSPAMTEVESRCLRRLVSEPCLQFGSQRVRCEERRKTLRIATRRTQWLRTASGQSGGGDELSGAFSERSNAAGRFSSSPIPASAAFKTLLLDLPGSVTVDSISASFQYQLVTAQHVVHVCQDFAECKSRLVLIEFALENARDEFRDGKCLRFTRLGDRAAALFVVFDQFVDACVEAIEWQSVTGQHQYVVRN